MSIVGVDWDEVERRFAAITKGRRDMKKTAREMVNDVQSKICDLQLDMLGQGHQLDRLKRDLDTAKSKLMIEEAEEKIREGSLTVVILKGGPRDGQRLSLGNGEFQMRHLYVSRNADSFMEGSLASPYGPCLEYGCYTPSSGSPFHGPYLWIFRGWYESQSAMHLGYNNRPRKWGGA